MSSAWLARSAAVVAAVTGFVPSESTWSKVVLATISGSYYELSLLGLNLHLHSGRPGAATVSRRGTWVSPATRC